METMGQDTTGPHLRSSALPRTSPGHASVTLDGFEAAIAQSRGVCLADLAPIDELEVHTRNSCYRITVVNPAEGRVLIQGGAFFPVTSPARIGGATLGGSMLKLGWIGHGFCLEIHDAHQCIVTTPVAAIVRCTSACTQPLC